MSKSLSALRAKSGKKPAKDESDDEESKNEEPASPSKPGGFMSRMGRNKGKKADNEGEDDDDDDNGEGNATPKRKGKKGGLFGSKLFGGKGKDDEGDEDEDDSDSSPKKKGSPKKKSRKKGDRRGDDSSDDEDRNSDSDEDDENQDSSNAAPQRRKRGGKGKRGQKGRRDDEDDEDNEDDENDGDDAAQAATGSNIQNQAFMRKQPKSKLETRLRERVRVVADMTPEVHFMGEITGGVGFGPGVSCKFTIEFGKNWDLLSGEYLGQTQYAYAEMEEMLSWNHPIDLHMATSSMQGWPRIRFQVWELDEYGRTNLSGYGFIHLPTNAGTYEICVPCWRPTGSLPEEIQSFFLGTNPQLTNESVLFSKAWENRCRLVTIPSGKIWLNVSVMHRFFQQQNVDLPGV